MKILTAIAFLLLKACSLKNGLNVSQNVPIWCIVDFITEGDFIFLDKKHLKDIISY